MNIRFNRTFASVMLFLILFIYIFGYSLTALLYNSLIPEKAVHLSLYASLLSNLFGVADYLMNLICAIIMFVLARKLGLDTRTWALIGLVYTLYAPLLLLILFINRAASTRSDLIRYFTWSLFWLVAGYACCFLVKYFSTPIVTHTIDTTSYMELVRLKNTFQVFPSVLFIFMNILLSVMMYRRLRFMTIRRKAVWVLSVLVFGLVPYILLNDLVYIRKRNIAESISS